VSKTVFDILRAAVKQFWLAGAFMAIILAMSRGLVSGIAFFTAFAALALLAGCSLEAPPRSSKQGAGLDFSSKKPQRLRSAVLKMRLDDTCQPINILKTE